MSDKIPAPRFTGLFIPAEILSIPDLSLLDQMLLAWIDGLYDEEEGGCFAKNSYLAEKLRVKENTIVVSLTTLRRKKLIEDISFNGPKRVMRTLIGKNVNDIQSKKPVNRTFENHKTKIIPTANQFYTDLFTKE